MFRYLFALSLLPVLPLLIGPAVAQTSPVQAPIACDIKDNVEVGGCLNKLKGLFTRSGDRLTLKFDGGKSKSYVGNKAMCDGANADAEKCLVFLVRRYYPLIQSFLVERAHYECGDYVFVSRRTGSETVMQEMPVLSPNADYLLSIDTSDACARKYDIAIWSMQTDPPKLEFKYKAKGYENWQVKAWQDDTHVKIKTYDQEAELIRNQNGRWTLKLGRKIDHPK